MTLTPKKRRRGNTNASNAPVVPTITREGHDNGLSVSTDAGIVVCQ
jgi:hypothetical protein